MAVMAKNFGAVRPVRNAENPPLCLGNNPKGTGHGGIIRTGTDFAPSNQPDTNRYTARTAHGRLRKLVSHNVRTGLQRRPRAIRLRPIPGTEPHLSPRGLAPRQIIERVPDAPPRPTRRPADGGPAGKRHDPAGELGRCLDEFCRGLHDGSVHVHTERGIHVQSRQQID